MADTTNQGPIILDYDPPRRWAAASRVGDLVFLAGETGTDPVTLETAEGGIAGQTEQAVSNIAATLARLGGSLDDIIKLTCFLTDIADLPTMSSVRARRFSRTIPSSSVAVAALARPDLLVEIEAVAHVPLDRAAPTT